MPINKARFWLTEGSESVVIHTDASTVYDLISDLPRMGEWSPECERVDWMNGTTSAVEGAEFVGHNRGGPFKKFRWSRHGHVLAADAGREFAFITDEGGRESTLWRYRLETVDDGTRVTESYAVKWIPVWARILDVPVNRQRELRETMRHTLEQLKAVAEMGNVEAHQ